MKTLHSWKSFIGQGRRWLAVPSGPSEFYVREDDEQGDDDYDRYPLRADMKEWLSVLPRGRWWVENMDGHYHQDPRQAAWCRPIYFRFRRDLMLFKLAWERG